MIYLSWLLAFLLRPDQSQSHLKLGLNALNHGDLTLARKELEEAERDQPQNAYVWTSLAQTYLRLGLIGESETAAEKAERTGASNAVVRHALGIYYFEAAQMLLRKEDFTHAAATVENGLQADPQNLQLILALGVARYGQRRFEDAIVQFLKVIALDPAVEQPYLFLGRMLDQAGNHLPEIVNRCKQWEHDHPESAKAKLTLAKALLAGDRRSTRAEDLLRSSIKLSDTDWESHYELGALLASNRQYQQATAELQRAIELDPKQPQPHYQLARVYDRLGQAERARSERAIHQALSGSAGEK